MANISSLEDAVQQEISLSEKMEQLCRITPKAYPVLQQLEENHQYFLATATHELQTILSLICRSIQSIEASHPEVRCYRYWPELSSDCHIMTKLLRDLTDYSMSAQLNPERTDLQLLLRKAYLSCLALTEGTNKTLTYTSRTACAYLSLDPAKMTEAVLNLIVNALDAVSEDGNVRLVLTKTSEKITVQVSDDGCGISPERLITIFQPFVTTKPGGTGLGLPVAKRIIEAHGGHIWISSAPGSGTTFTFVLPCCESTEK